LKALSLAADSVYSKVGERGDERGSIKADSMAFETVVLMVECLELCLVAWLVFLLVEK